MPEILLLWRIAVKKGSTAMRKRNRQRGSPCLTPRLIVKVGVRKPLTRISDVASVCRVAIVSTNLCETIFGQDFKEPLVVDGIKSLFEVER